MGRGLDTDWAEAKDSKEDELSRLRRLGSSVESGEREEGKRKKVTPVKTKGIPQKLKNTFGMILMSSQSTANIKNDRSDEMNVSNTYRREPAETGEQSARCGGWLICLSSAPLLLGRPHISQSLRAHTHTHTKGQVINVKLNASSQGHMEVWGRSWAGTCLFGYQLTHQEQPETRGILAVSTVAH